MNHLPDLVEIESCSGEDYVEKVRNYINLLYKVYLRSIVRDNLLFRGIPVYSASQPMTYGKHFSFWHIIQEGKIEDDRCCDLERCKRILWINWVIKNADRDARIRVFPQLRQGVKESWVLWLYEEDYAVILHRRSNYYLLKTAFVVQLHKKREFERDWNAAASS